MPIYEYECSACAHRLEALQKISEPVLTHCPECHKEDLHRLVSAAGFQLKGTGWYATDFRNSGKPLPAKTATDSTTSTETTKTDATSTTTDSSKKDTAAK